jgi:hypothetical protein
MLVREKNNRQKFSVHFANKRGDLSVDKEKAVLRLPEQNIILEEVCFVRGIWFIMK